jgi:hypothetical protein
MNRSAEGQPMKRAFLVSIGVMVPAAVLAHSSVMPHEHPHGVSLLPDLGALLLAALLVGGAVMALRQFRKGTKP